ncbi:DJ-1/PfpI family protein [Oricola sp.]|uniref:DJ-1/PfpI family protein n=1 Tax=Oricola sp. TaxID=1979950 RepID=UPI003BA951DE
MARIAVILTQQFADWEYALIAGTGGPFFQFEIGFFAPEAGEVTSQGGLTALVPHTTDEIADWQPDAIAVIGGMVWESDAAPDLADLLRSQHARGGTVAGICGGTLALARAGLLDDIAHTSNDAEFLKQNSNAYAGAVHYKASASAVADNRIITAPGSAPVSFTAAVFEAAGLDQDSLGQFRSMLAAEHG